ncbi:hypothetical protein HBI32_118130 [Parastagonospora nodorum]|nr:hypothetical protein HBI32_118130 [Parastagonospora nodorum]
MLRRSYVGSKGLVSLEQCSTISRCLYLLLRVLGAGAALSLAIPIFLGAECWRICCLGSISLASLG